MLKTCSDCRYYRQHYLKDHRGYYPSGVGHCQYPKVKPAPEDKPACEFFEPLKKEG